MRRTRIARGYVQPRDWPLSHTRVGCVDADERVVVDDVALVRPVAALQQESQTCAHRMHVFRATAALELPRLREPLSPTTHHVDGARVAARLDEVVQQRVLNDVVVARDEDALVRAAE